MNDTIDNVEIDPPRTIGQASAETEALTKYLRAAEVSSTITYADMKEACKVDIQEHPHHLQTARRRLLKERIAFGTVIGIGIRRLTDSECPDEARDKQDRAKRTAKRGLAILNCGDLSKMDSETKVKAITTRTILGFMSGSGSRKTINLAEQAARSSSDLKIGNIASLFAK